MNSSPTLSNKLIISIGVGVGATLLSGFGYWFYQNYKRNLIPKKWRRVGTLEELYLFPIKSCGAIKVEADNSVNCELLGMNWQGVNDRSLIVLDEKYGIVTGRTYSKMIVIKTEIISPKILRLSAENVESIDINFEKLLNEKEQKKIIPTSIFGSKLTVMLCGDKYDAWFSKVILGKPKGLHLATFHHDKPVRPIDKGMKHEAYFQKKDTGTLGDATSYMLMNLASVDDLNKRLKKPVNPLQFRGNFYLKMDNNEPYVEDNWRWIKIGDEAIFCIVAPCTRCIMPNINTENGERDENFEPLRTLKTYRKVKNYPAPPLGVHMGLRQNGVVKLHDVIYVGEE